MEAAISAIRTHDTHKLLSAKAAFLRLSPDEKARFARFFEAEARRTPSVYLKVLAITDLFVRGRGRPRSCRALWRFKFLRSFSAALRTRPLVFFHR